MEELRNAMLRYRAKHSISQGELARMFLANPDNIQNCEECPYNEHFDNFQGRYPCGQWNCWVDLE